MEMRRIDIFDFMYDENNRIYFNEDGEMIEIELSSEDVEVLIKNLKGRLINDKVIFEYEGEKLFIGSKSKTGEYIVDKSSNSGLIAVGLLTI